MSESVQTIDLISFNPLNEIDSLRTICIFLLSTINYRRQNHENHETSATATPGFQIT